MLRRSALQLASRSSVSRAPLQTTAQVPSYLSSRRCFSVSQKNEPDSSRGTRRHSAKFIAGSVALGSAFLGAYYLGYLDRYLKKEKLSIGEYSKVGSGDKNLQILQGLYSHEKVTDSDKLIQESSSDETDALSPGVNYVLENSDARTETATRGDSIAKDEEKIFLNKDTPEESSDQVDGVNSPDPAQSNLLSDDVTSASAEENFSLNGLEVVKSNEEGSEATEVTPTVSSIEEIPNRNVIDTVSSEQNISQETHELVDGNSKDSSASLLGDYYLSDHFEDSAALPSSEVKEDIHDSYISKDGKLILDFLQALHAAEKRQAELDAKYFAEEKKVMKEKYEKDLKDARIREVMYAEKEAILENELNKERVRAAAALKSLQEKLEEKLEKELELKEKEAEKILKEKLDIAKAELTAAIASEKASQIEKMAEANLHINALCMAFYARSEEVLQSHSVHKLALGALALEDALTKGFPIQNEIEALHSHLVNADRDSLITLVLSSLPEDSLKSGTDTLPQLNQKFGLLKGTLRHFSLIPPGGGGVLAHSLAWVASWLKVKEVDKSGDGIESLINKVDSLLAQGKLIEAADALENGVQGTQASEVVDEWIKRARDRAITEQALQVLRAYATSISLT